ncbi:MAG: AMP-binding protein, partial [Myxococcota bacterium]
GLLLPISCGARITYLEHLDAKQLQAALRTARVTCLVGVPALWKMLEQSMRSHIDAQGKVISILLKQLMQLNQTVGKTTGIEFGKVLFAPLHQKLGGHLRYLISGGAALPKQTHELFQSLGLPLSEGYGLTEAAPVLTVAKATPQQKAGHVGKPIPGVHIRIHQPNEHGIGEIVAKGENIMLGYEEQNFEHIVPIDDEGWLHTGDLGKFDHRGRLTLVGRQKEVILTQNGENIYPDDLEKRMSLPNNIEEWTIVGLSNAQGLEQAVLVVVPKSNITPKQARQTACRAIETLPEHSRPSQIFVSPRALPKTSTRKTKRKEVAAWVEQQEKKRLKVHAKLDSSSLSHQLLDTLS